MQITVAPRGKSCDNIRTGNHALTQESPMSTTEKLNELNTLRAARNQAPLKSWKGSTAALDQTITAYKTKKVEPAVAEGAYANERQAEASTGLKGTHQKKRDAIAKANVRHDSLDDRAAAADKANAPKPEKGSMAQHAKNKKDIKQAARAGKKQATSNLVSLADIAREIGIEPKLARAKARRSDELTKMAKGDSWAFAPADVKKVKELLK